jgi:opacity protein-like surface antigen
MKPQSVTNKAIHAAIFVALAFLVGPTSLMAQSDNGSPKRFRFGIGASGIRPAGEFGNLAGDGLGWSLMLEWEPNRKMALRGRAEYMAFAKKDYRGEYGSTSASAMAAFLDYVFRLGPNNRCLYLFGGAGLMSCTYMTEWTPRNGGGTDTYSKTSMALSAGGGWNVTKNFGLDFSMNIAIGAPDKEWLYLPTDATDYPPFNWLQMTARWRF